MYISYKLYGLRNKTMYIREAGHVPLEKGVAGHGKRGAGGGSSGCRARKTRRPDEPTISTKPGWIFGVEPRQGKDGIWIASFTIF